MLFNRTVRTLVPSMISKPNTKAVKKQPTTQGKPLPLPILQPGDNVRFHDGSIWTRRAQVLAKAPEPRSYIIKADKNTTIRRNRCHLLKTTEQYNLSDTSDLESLLQTNETSEDSDNTIAYEEEEQFEENEQN